MGSQGAVGGARPVAEPAARPKELPLQIHRLRKEGQWLSECGPVDKTSDLLSATFEEITLIQEVADSNRTRTTLSFCVPRTSLNSNAIPKAGK